MLKKSYTEVLFETEVGQNDKHAYCIISVHNDSPPRAATQPGSTQEIKTMVKTVLGEGHAPIHVSFLTSQWVREKQNIKNTFQHFINNVETTTWPTTVGSAA